MIHVRGEHEYTVLDSRVNGVTIKGRVPSLLAKYHDMQLALVIDPDMNLRALAIVLRFRPYDRRLLEHAESVLAASTFGALRYLQQLRSGGLHGSRKMTRTRTRVPTRGIAVVPIGFCSMNWPRDVKSESMWYWYHSQE